MSLRSTGVHSPVAPVRTQDYLDAVAQHAAGVTVVTSVEYGRPAGTTVSTFASHSIDPPMVSCDLAENSATLTAIRWADRFAVHLLADDQSELALRFAGRGDRFAGEGWSWNDGLPALAGIVARFVCELQTTVHVGDHVVVFGTVTDTLVNEDKAPLLHQNRTFRQVGPSTEAIGERGR